MAQERIRQVGPIRMMKFDTELVRSHKPDAQLIFGDWNVHGEEYFNFLRQMRENDIDIDLIGLQSHICTRTSGRRRKRCA